MFYEWQDTWLEELAYGGAVFQAFFIEFTSKPSV